MEKKYIDMNEFSRAMGCTFEEVQPAPGVTIQQTHWSRNDYLRIRAALRMLLEDNPDYQFSIYGSPDPWNTVALVREFRDIGLKYAYPKPDHPELVELDLSPLPVADRAPADNYDVQYELRETEDAVYINMTSDNPARERPAGTPHTFTIANTTKVSLPPVTPGKDVYIHGWGMYCVMCCVASTLADTARSVFLSCHDGDYVCCATKTPEHKIGEHADRSWENTLPHCV